MNKFKQNPSCDKCGHVKMTIKHKTIFSHVSVALDVECLAVTCDRCGYSFEMETKDSTEESK